MGFAAGDVNHDATCTEGDLAPEHTGGQGFFITETGNYLLMSYYPAERDLSAFKCRDQDGSTRQCSTMEPADDSVIQEVTPEGNEVFLRNSWDHVKIEDCPIRRFPNDYAHLNSLHELEGDVVAGFRGCAQVLRIERATGAVVWQIGGRLPMRADHPTPASGAARYLELVGDPEGEFCGQHQVTATSAGSLLMFDALPAETRATTGACRTERALATSSVFAIARQQGRVGRLGGGDTAWRCRAAATPMGGFRGGWGGRRTMPVASRKNLTEARGCLT